MSTLYDLTAEQLALLDMVESAESPEEIEAITNTLAVSREEFTNKVEGYVAVINAMEQREAVRKTEIERLKTLADSDKKKVSQLKERLISAMQATDQKKVETNLYKITVRKGMPKVEIDNEALLVSYSETKEVVSLNRRRLLEDLKAGKSVLGARLGEGSPSLQIA